MHQLETILSEYQVPNPVDLALKTGQFAKLACPVGFIPSCLHA
jgi:hypothetical protein